MKLKAVQINALPLKRVTSAEVWVMFSVLMTLHILFSPFQPMWVDGSGVAWSGKALTKCFTWGEKVCLISVQAKHSCRSTADATVARCFFRSFHNAHISPAGLISFPFFHFWYFIIQSNGLSPLSKTDTPLMEIFGFSFPLTLGSLRRLIKIQKSNM